MSEDVWRKGEPLCLVFRSVRRAQDLAATHEHLANFAQSLIIATKTLTASGKAGLTVKHPLPAEKCRAGCIALATQFSQKVNALALAAKPPVYGEAGWKAIRVTATELEEVGSRLLFSANALSQSLLGQELRCVRLHVPGEESSASTDGPCWRSLKRRRHSSPASLSRPGTRVPDSRLTVNDSYPSLVPFGPPPSTSTGPR